MKSILLMIVGLLALVAFVTYAVLAETGPIGWIDAAQASVFGSYSRKLSLLVLLGVVGIPATVVWSMVSPNSLRGAKQAVSARPAKPTSMLTMALVGWVVFVALVWAGAYGYAAWEQRLHEADASATYVPLELVPGMKDAAAGRDRLALHGRILGDHVVSRNEGSDKLLLVPVVEPSWHEGDPVHFVMRLGSGGEAALRSALSRPAESLRVRTDGSVPTPARQVFERMRAPLADDAVALALVPATAGQPAAAAPAGGFDTLLWAIVGTVIVTLFFVFFGSAAALSERQGRKDAARALKRSQR